MRLQEILATLSLILFYAAIPLLIPFAYAYYYAEPSFEPIGWVIAIMMAPSIPVFVPGFFKWVFSALNSIFMRIFRKEAHWNYALNVITKRPELSELKFGDILTISAISWLIIPLIASYPFYTSGLSPTDSIFESMSGWTSTGLSVITSFENIPNSIIVYRSLTQWVGGVGIVILMLAFIRHRQARSLLASDGKSSSDTNLQKTASKIWKIYVGLTTIAILALFWSGFSWFDSFNLGVVGTSTGGFFPFLSYEMVWIQKIILTATLFVGAVSFMTHDKLLAGKINALISQEFLLYVFLILAGTGLMFSISHDDPYNALLNTVGAISSGGYGTGDLSIMHEFSIYVLIVLMICGGMYGSTSGGLKLWRILVALKFVWSRIHSSFLPAGTVQVLDVDGSKVQPESISEVMGYIFMYLMICLVSAGILIAWNHSLLNSMFTVASAFGNVGLSTIDISILPQYEKAFLAFIMYIGRIEIFPFLALLSFAMGKNR